MVHVGVPVESGARGHGEGGHEDGGRRRVPVVSGVGILSGSRHNMAAYALGRGPLAA